MIAVGVVTGMASGVALPGHMLLFGEVINNFVYYSIATETVLPNIADFLSNSSSGEMVSDVQCNSSRVMQIVSDISQEGMQVSLCSGNQSGNVFSEINDFLCEPADELESRITLYAYYYLALAFGVLLTTFLSNALLNLSAYRQTRRMRVAFFRNVLHQEIGWFDVTESAELSTRLAE